MSVGAPTRVDYLPGVEMTLDATADALAAALELHDGAPALQTDRTYYDTFDGLLHAAGLLAVYEDGEMALVDRHSGAVRASLSMDRPTEPVFASVLQAGALRDALLPIVDVRALLVLAQVRGHKRVLNVLDDERKTVVRLTLEAPARVGPEGGSVALAARLRVTPVRGYDEELEKVRATLERELGFKAAGESLVDEAVRVSGGDPGGISSKVKVPLKFEDRADGAAVTVLRALVGVIEANIEGTLLDLDSEFLHDFRVSVRRSRALQRELKGVFPPGPLAAFREEFRWLQQITGDSRDLDVYVLEFDAMRVLVPEPMRPDLDALLSVLRRRRLAARRELVSTLRSGQVSSLLSRWSMFLDELESLPEYDRPDAGRPIGAVAGERIAKVYRRMVKMGRAIDDSSPPEAFHALRKKGKELRYLLELLGASLYPDEVVKPMVKSLKALQDVLGRHQDREVQMATLSALRDDVAGVPGGRSALMAMGALVASLHEDELAARSEFAQRFSAFAAKAQRKLVADTFG